jgi:hypothetical protein
MADMDTYDGEQRGYEGNYAVEKQGGYTGDSEIHAASNIIMPFPQALPSLYTGADIHLCR